MDYSPPCGLSRQEYWSGLPFPSPGHLPNPGTEHRSSAGQVDSLPSRPLGKPITVSTDLISTNLSERDRKVLSRSWEREGWSLHSRQSGITPDHFQRCQVCSVCQDCSIDPFRVAGPKAPAAQEVLMQMAISGTQKALLNVPNGGPRMCSDLAVAMVAGREKQPRRLCFRVPAQDCLHYAA